jgi:hypothetical protein
LEPRPSTCDMQLPRAWLPRSSTCVAPRASTWTPRLRAAPSAYAWSPSFRLVFISKINNSIRSLFFRQLRIIFLNQIEKKSLKLAPPSPQKLCQKEPQALFTLLAPPERLNS